MNNKIPQSPTNMWINSVALLVVFIVLWGLKYFKPEITVIQAAMLICIALALPIIILEWVCLKPYKRASATIRLQRNGKWNPNRALTKLLGFYIIIALVAMIYWLFPEYEGSFYNHYYNFLSIIIWPVCLFAIPYFFILDRFMVSPNDEYWHLGALFSGRFHQVDFHKVMQLFLGWLVKLFFLPLMFVYLVKQTSFIYNFDFNSLFSSYKAFYDFSYALMFFIDLLFVTVGYLCTIRLFDSHIRSTDSTLLGWGSALVCYQPFWGMISGSYLDYQSSATWGYWFADSAMYTIWGSLILLLIAIYVWATLPFGIRFSNLTHRGILTNGPYRYCKHPAYVSKNLSWWLISMPFITTGDTTDAIRQSILLLLLNGIYFIRARTEERHLSWDNHYVEYAKYIEEHGIFSFLGKWFPILKFKRGYLLNLNQDKATDFNSNNRTNL